VKQFTSKTQQIGLKGENICTMFLVKHGHHIVERNYTKPSGEIDIITMHDKRLHFIEVKAVSCATHSNIKNMYNPLQNIDPRKLKKIKDTIKHFLAEKEAYKVPHETDWQLDAYAVYVDKHNIKHRLKKIENIQ